MKNTRLIRLIDTLNSKEERELKRFLQSPFFNKRVEVFQLFEFLVENLRRQKYIPNKQESYAYLTTNQSAYDDQQMRLWMSFLLKLIEKYLVHKSFFENEINSKIELARIYRQRNLSKQAERVLKESQLFQKKAEIQNANYYTNEFHLEMEQYRLTSSTKRMGELNIQKISDSLDNAYLSQKLRQFCFALSHQNVYKTEYRFGLLDEVIKYVENKQLFKIPAIGVYYYGYLALSQNDSPPYFPIFKESILKNGDQFPPEELADLYILAINFCIKKYNAGDRQFIKDEFEIYQSGLKEKLFLKNDILSRFTYRNIVTLGLILEEFDWIESFIAEYKNSLDKDYKESMYSFCYARLEYARKNYDSALQLLQKANYKDLLLNLAAKTVMLKIFFELDEFDLLDSHMGAMQTFIRRKKIIGYHQENYMTLIQFLKRLMDIAPYDKSASKTLLEEIQNTNSVAEKEWLIQQCS